jgi:RNA polymerase sigma-70 factor (ECF subfamily)
LVIRVPLDAQGAGEGDEFRGKAGQVAFDDLWQHRAALHDLCQRIVGDAATADDVVQETYMKALHNLDRLEQRPSLMPWLATVARRRSIDELRRRRYQSPVDAMPDDSTKPELDPGESVSVTETVGRVREALTALTARERDLLMRQVNQGLSLAELAMEDASSVASVRSVLSRARTKLRAALTDAGARVIAPVALLGGWLKRKTAHVAARAHQAAVMPVSYERVGDVFAVGVAAGALVVAGIAPALPGSGSSSGNAGTDTPTLLADGVDQAGYSTDAPDDVETIVVTLPDGTTREVRVLSDGSSSDSSSGGGPGPDSTGPGTDGGGGNPDPGPPVTNPADPRVPSGPPPVNNPVHDPEPEPDDPDDAELFSLGGTTSPTGGGGSGGASDDGVLFAAGRYKGDCTTGTCFVLFKSTDGGRSWTKPAATGLAGSQLMVAPGYPTDSRIYVMGPSGLQASNNGGDTFVPVLDSPYSGPATMSPGFSGADRRIFIGTTSPWAFRETSTSGPAEGDAEPLVLGLPGTEHRFAFPAGYAGQGTFFAGSTAPDNNDVLRPAVYLCENVCHSPVRLPGMSKAPTVSVTAAGAVFAYGSGGKLYRAAGSSGPFLLVADVPVGNVTALVEDASGNLFASVRGAAGGGLLRSIDGGQHWDTVGEETALSEGAFTVSAVGGRLLASPSSGGILCSTDAGETWASACRGN